ncbi:MAG: c-type cytochrome [Gemmatimonadaceae bacterium]|jgi:mono/diheme cytochrome c family protein|nr:c-type cytochrome [Gemmatimonadaceae bacterium]
MRGLPLVLFTVALAACGGAKEGASDAAPAAETPAAAPAAAASFDPSSITAAELALGDSVYHGLIGATSCQACHGADGTQATVAPNLTDAEWLHSDGSFEGIYKTIETGVMTPKQYSSIMPPFGGAPLDPAKHRAVAAYVYRLGHKQ